MEQEEEEAAARAGGRQEAGAGVFSPAPSSNINNTTTADATGITTTGSVTVVANNKGSTIDCRNKRKARNRDSSDRQTSTIRFTVHRAVLRDYTSCSRLSFILLTLLSILLMLGPGANCYPLDPIEEEIEHPRLSLISWRWQELEGYLIVSMFLLTAALVKVVYHQIDSLHTHVPESCVLIVLGTTVGVIIHFADMKELQIPQFSSELFFFLLLPPIILESAYSLHDKTFFNNINAVMLYAVVGTLLNVFFVGSSLFLVEQFGWFGRADIPLVECFTFSTLISAVDPVAVLAIFQELGVNKEVYFLVFGESLLNDAVVITLYNMVTTFAVSRVISTYDVVIGILNFITVSGGGLVIGLLTGAVTALATKFTTDVRVVEPLIVVVLAYFSYVGAELFHFSGIISLIACGLVQSEYVKDNISKRSFTTIKYFTKTLSSIADVIIFFFLGRVLIHPPVEHVWVRKPADKDLHESGKQTKHKRTEQGGRRTNTQPSLRPLLCFAASPPSSPSISRAHSIICRLDQLLLNYSPISYSWASFSPFSPSCSPSSSHPHSHKSIFPRCPVCCATTRGKHEQTLTRQFTASSRVPHFSLSPASLSSPLWDPSSSSSYGWRSVSPAGKRSPPCCAWHRRQQKRGDTVCRTRTHPSICSSLPN